MKKLISIVLSIAIFITCFAAGFEVVSARIEYKSISAFSAKINELINTYDDYDDNQTIIKNRLIIPVDKPDINEYGAVESVYGLGYAVLQYDNDEDCETAKEKLITEGYNAEYDSIISCADVNSTESTSRTWGNDRIESKETLNAIKASGKELSEVTVGIIDTGVDYTHPDLKERIVDTSLNFSSSGKADSSMDDQGHGTMVAGIVMQNTTDNVKIKPYKVLNKDGKCATSQIISVVNHILAEKNAPSVINLSLGGEYDKLDPFEKTLRSLIESLVGKGCTVVVAAGNESSDAGNYSPSNISNVITVSASTSSNEKSYYSNYGSIVDIAAPGDNIYTTNLGGGYTSSHSGTSFSAPFVTAAAATVLMLDNSLTSMQVESKIKDAAFPIVNDTGVDWCGAGILNYSALYDDVLAPAPTFSQESGAYNDIIHLTAQAENGYTIRYTTDNTIPTLANGETFDGTMTIGDSKSFVAVAINEINKSKYIPLNYSVIYLADENDFEITDKGAITAYNGNKNSIIVPDTIKGITPTSVAISAFTGSDIKTIELPKSITKLNRTSFSKCNNLTKVTALGVTEVGVMAFLECTNLIDVNMPNVKLVQRQGFAFCNKLKTVDFNETVEDLYNNAFESSGIENAYFPNIYYLDGVFIDTPLVSIDCPLVYEVSEAFRNCYNLQYVNLPSLTEINNYAFQNCKQLTEFDFSNISYLGNYALAYSSFTNIELINLQKLDGNGVFAYCEAEYINIPQVEMLREYTFRGAKNVKHINMPNYVDCKYAVEGTNYKVLSVFEDNFSLEELYVPNAIYLPCFTLSNNDSVSDQQNQINKMNLKWIYAPKLEMVEEDLFRRKLFGFCGNLEWAFLPSLSCELEVLPCSNATLYFSDKVSFVNAKYDVNSYGYLRECTPKIVAPIGSLAEQWADKYNFTFIPSESCAFTGIDGENFVYTCTDNNNQCSLPISIVNDLWQEYMPINESKSFMAHGFLLDLVPDQTINAKDFAQILKHAEQSDNI